MTKTKSVRLLSVILTAVMLACAVAPAVYADDAESNGSGGSSLSQLSTDLNAISYREYLEKYSDVQHGRNEIVLKGKDYNPDAAGAAGKPEIVSDPYGGREEVILTTPEESAVWEFELDSAAMYSIKIEYAAATGSTNQIERVLKINGSVPFAEARYIKMNKTWQLGYTSANEKIDRENTNIGLAIDANGNELRPKAHMVEKWETMELKDQKGYYVDPMSYYFRAGKNTIAIEGEREDVYIKSITLFSPADIITYEEAAKSFPSSDAGSDKIYINAEFPDYISNYTIYSDYDRSSAASEPQHPTQIRRNMIGGDNWQTTGDWVEYSFEIEHAGVYEFVLRYRQDLAAGVYTSRSVKIDGEVPYIEATGCRFSYDADWQTGALSADGKESLKFYLEPGKHTLSLEATVGNSGEILSRVNAISDKLNDYYLQIIKLTGNDPDTSRDYGFARVMPEVLRGLVKASNDLNEIVEEITALNGGKSEATSTLEAAAKLFRSMGYDEYVIAGNLDALKDYASSIDSWIGDMENQPLSIDYIIVQGTGGDIPSAKPSMIEGLVYNFKQFIGSFYANYDSIVEEDDSAKKYDSEILCWTTSGRDQAQIIKSLVDSDFIPETNIGVTVNLVAQNALLPSILAGIGPDVSLDAEAVTNLINYAVRGAVKPLNDKAGFNEIIARFNDAAVTQMSLYGKTYALPFDQKFPMMFVRTDVLADLGLEVPNTWDELMAMIPVLQYNNMSVGMQPITDGWGTFLFQETGKSYWDESYESNTYTDSEGGEHKSEYTYQKFTDTRNGWKTRLDDNDVLSAFERMCNMFTQYSLPIEYNFVTRFKYGEMPIAIQSYEKYTEVVVSAPEIAGLWEMFPIPGTLKEDGSISRTAAAKTSGIMMVKGCDDEDAAWKFMCWYTDEDFQVNYCDEMVSLLGPSAKTTTANVAALRRMSWSTREINALSVQWDNLMGIPDYLGTYYITRHIEFAFRAAYNNGADPVSTLLSYINAVNTEITRKRNEFDYPLYEDEVSD